MLDALVNEASSAGGSTSRPGLAVVAAERLIATPIEPAAPARSLALSASPRA